MPLYEYQCKANGHRFEVRHGMNEDPIKTCPDCGAEVRRTIHPVGIVFKGTGFYATDSRSTPATAKPAASSTSESGEGGKSDKKPDASAEKAAAS